MKKLIRLALICAFAVSFSLPGGAAAAAPKAFNATLQVWAVDPGTVTQVGARRLTTGEKINGIVVASPEWSELAGAFLVVDHSSNVLIDPATGNILDGHAHASFALVRDGSAISGVYRSKISGNFSGMPGTSFTDEGGWTIVKATGVYAGTQSHGNWTATLGPAILGGIPTFAGLAQFSGTYN